jgi:moderate conductance mechanosensitive channel
MAKSPIWRAMLHVTAPPSETSNVDVTGVVDAVVSFVNGLMTLDPEEAAIRSGISVLVVIGAMLLIWGLRVLYKAITERVAPEHAGNLGKRALPLGRWALRIARFAIALAALLAILRIWGLNYEDLREGPLGAALGAATRIAVILVIAFTALELAQLAISRMFARIASRSRNPRRAAQVRTLAPLLSGVVTTTLIVIAAMMALSEIGVEIGPLIAGAGIIGLAVGFGAQTLVKDFLTGIFLILEDIVSIGDIIEIGGFGGVVEEMSLRTIKLRDFEGVLHVFPYSEAQVIHNRTKGFAFAVFDLSISYKSDIPLALETMRRVGAELRADADLVGQVLEDIEVVGVDALADSAVVLKARIKTAPGKQWTVKREYLQRIKIAFDQAGVEIPFPHVKLVPPDPPGGAAGA